MDNGRAEREINFPSTRCSLLAESCLKINIKDGCRTVKPDASVNYGIKLAMEAEQASIAS